MPAHRLPIARVALLLAVCLIGLAPLASRAQTDPPATVVASNLVNPRGMAWDDAGNPYVAIAGTSGVNAGVARIEDGCPVMTVTGLPAYRIVFGAPTGVAAVAFRAGLGYFLLSGGDTNRGDIPNGLYRFQDDGSYTLAADISAFIRDNAVSERPRDFDTDGQPYALLPMGDAFWVTEGNSNQLLRVGLDGTVGRVADLSAGHPIPTGIAPAPGGGAYVGFLTSAPYRDGAARVVAIAPDGTTQEVWTGLTLVTALATGPDGALYALEMATGIDPDDPASIAPGRGRVVRQTGPDTARPMVTGLSLPVAMAFGPDGALYVAGPVVGADNGEGTILRIDLAAPTPIDVSGVAAAQCPTGAVGQ